MKKIISILILLFVCSVQGQSIRLLNALARAQTGVSSPAPVFVSNTKTEVRANNITLTKPASISTGDLLIILLIGNNGGTNVFWDDSSNKPSGFTLININDGVTPRFASYYRIADGTESSTINVTSNGTSIPQVGFYIHITGANASPIGNEGSDILDVSGTTLALTGVAGNDNDLGMYILSGVHDTALPFSTISTGWSVEDEGEEPFIVDSGGCFGWKTYDDTSLSDVTITSSVSNRMAGFQFRILAE